MMNEHLIAVVEDDPELRRLMVRRLGEDGFATVSCKNAIELDKALESRDIDAIVLDIMMPGEDGFSVCRRIGPTANLPIIIVSARSDDLDRILGLELGADDYLVKPFNPRELVARLRAVLRRSARRGVINTQDAPESEVYTFNGWRLDVNARSLLDPEGATVGLSGGEMALLIAFVRHPRRVLTRDQLLDWTRTAGSAPFDRAIDVQLSRLRAKLGEDPRQPLMIKTLRGEGYLFAPLVTRLAVDREEPLG